MNVPLLDKLPFIVKDCPANTLTIPPASTVKLSISISEPLIFNVPPLFTVIEVLGALIRNSNKPSSIVVAPE